MYSEGTFLCYLDFIGNVVRTQSERKSVPKAFQKRSKQVLSTFKDVPVTTQTLHSFCKENRLPKSSVHRRCQELQIDTSGGLTEGDRDRLLTEFGKKPVVRITDVEVLPPEMAIVPTTQTSQMLCSSDDIAPRMQLQVTAYDTSEMRQAKQINGETFLYNLDAIGMQLVETAAQRGKYYAAKAGNAFLYHANMEISAPPENAE